MGLFKKIFAPKSVKSKSFRLALFEKIAAHHLKYVTENTETGEVIIGKEGGCNIREGNFIVLADNKIVFRCPLDALQAYELMSLEGAVLEGPDTEHDGAPRKITVYYKYYR